MKTPKEEALEIVLKFMIIPDEAMKKDSTAAWIDNLLAIRCSIIYVKGLIKELRPNEYKMNGMVLVESVHDRILELKKVLTELKKM